MLALGGAPRPRALTLMPALCSPVLRGRIRETTAGSCGCASGLYTPLLHSACANDGWWCCPWLTPGGSSWLSSATRRRNCSPNLTRGDFHLRSWSARAALSDSEASEMQCTCRASAAPTVFRNRAHVSSRVGTDEIASDPLGVNVSGRLPCLPRREWRARDGEPIERDASPPHDG